MKRAILALQFLTRLPLPQVAATDADFAAAIRWFPAAGLAVGAAVAAAGWAGAQVDGWIGALCALAAWTAITGALHLDGLADLADAQGAAHRDRTRMLEVLRDPHVGGFGVTAIALQLIAKLVLLHHVIGATTAALLLVPPVARIGILVWARLLPPLHQGLGARFATAVRARDLLLWALFWLAACWWFPALLAALPLVAGWWLWLRQRLGGVSGDCHGAGIELVETGLLLALAVAGRF